MSSQVIFNSNLNIQENNYENTCQYITARNKKCRNKVSVNGKCTFHNNRINKIINSGVCRKLSFDTCDGYNFLKQIENKNILEKCNEISSININEKCYCENHYKSYKFGVPDECAICTDHISYNEEVPLHCGHWFHLNCLKMMNKIECPMCRSGLNENEVKMLFKLCSILFKNSDNTDFIIKVPEKIIKDTRCGLTYIELIYLEIMNFFKYMNYNYSSEIINKIMMNIFQNKDYFDLSLILYNMFIPVIENGKPIMYIVKEEINFEEDNYYTLNYDNFQDILENMYNSF